MKPIKSQDRDMSYCGPSEAKLRAASYAKLVDIVEKM